MADSLPPHASGGKPGRPAEPPLSAPELLRPFVMELWELRESCGSPAFQKMADRVPGSSKDSMRRVLYSRKLDSLDRVLQFVNALGGDGDAATYWTRRWNDTNARLGGGAPTTVTSGPPPEVPPQPDSSKPGQPAMIQEVVAEPTGGSPPAPDLGIISTPSPGPQPSAELMECADRLAETVLQQWRRELDLRRVWDPRPLPVTWTSADQKLVERWNDISMALRSGPPGSQPSEEPYPDGHHGEMRQRELPPPPRLAGGGDDIARVFRQLPTRRLVVLGGPGSGKSVLLGRLVVDLLEERERVGRGAVPVIVPAASWSPKTQDLWTWLKARLIAAYPGLDRPMPGQRLVRSGERVRQVDELLGANLLLPIIDGLDEIPGRVLARAIAEINNALPMHRDIGLVVSCRATEFGGAVGKAPKIRNAFGITLRDLDPVEVRAYLEHDAGDDRWDPIVAHLDGDTPVARTLRVPLYVSLARTIYNPHSGNVVDDGPAHAVEPTEVTQPAGPVWGGRPDPRDLLDDGLRTDDDVKGQLFRAFIPAAYRASPPGRGGSARVGRRRSRPWRARTYTAAQAERWLTYLAGHLEAHLGGGTDLDWWDIPRAAPRGLAGAVVGAAAGLAAGLVALSNPRLGIGLGIGMLVALAVALPVRLLSDRRLAGQASNGRTLASSLVWGVVGGLAGSIVGGSVGLIGIGAGSGPMSATAGALAVGLAVGPSGGRLGGALGGMAGGCAAALTAGIGHGMFPALIDGLAIALGVGFAVGLGRADEPAEKLRWSPAGLVGGCAIGAGVGLGTYFGFDAGMLDGLVAGLTAGVATGMATGLRGMAPTDLTLAAGPQTLFARDRTTFAIVTCIFSITMLFGTYLPEGYAVSLGTALAGALAIGLAGGFLQACWGAVTISRVWLALRGHLPWDLMAFLADAHENRGVLRQAGAHYQYRHAEFQRHLAARAADPADPCAR